MELLAYANDITLLGDDVETIKHLGRKLINAAEKAGLTGNNNKTEYFIVRLSNKNYGLEQYIELEVHAFKRVSQFKHLALIIT